MSTGRCAARTGRRSGRGSTGRGAASCHPRVVRRHALLLVTVFGCSSVDGGNRPIDPGRSDGAPSDGGPSHPGSNDAGDAGSVGVDAGDAGAPCSSGKPGDATWTIPSGTTSRTTAVHVPASYALGGNVPLVINLHGQYSDGAQQELLSKMSAKAVRRRFRRAVSGRNRGCVECGRKLLQSGGRRRRRRCRIHSRPNHGLPGAPLHRSEAHLRDRDVERRVPGASSRL